MELTEEEKLQNYMVRQVEDIVRIMKTIKDTKGYEKEVDRQIQAIERAFPNMEISDEEVEEELKSLQTQKSIHQKCIDSNLEVLDMNVESLKKDCDTYVEKTGGSTTSNTIYNFIDFCNSLDLTE